MDLNSLLSRLGFEPVFSEANNRRYSAQISCFISFSYHCDISPPVQGTPRNGCGKRCQQPDFRPECLTPTCPRPLAKPGHLCLGEGRQIRHVGSTRDCCGRRKRTFHLLRSSSGRCGDRDLEMLVVRCRKMRNCKNRRRESRRFRVLGRMHFLCWF